MNLSKVNGEPTGRVSGTLRFATFLAPSVFPVYSYICEYLASRLDVPVELVVGRSFGEFERGDVDAGFICGLPYVQLRRHSRAPVELLAAPVLLGERYGGRPIYYSDVIVHSDSPYRSFADLRGCVWSFNDRDSQSGYGITRHKLIGMGETRGYFGRVVEAGFHQESIRMVSEGKIDASAIDSQVLAIALREDPELGKSLRIVDALGPSTIQPVVAARHLPDRLKADLSEALITMASDQEARARIAEALFERFVPVTDSDYEDIREMLRAAEDAGFTTVK